jgi:hypothetical protein
MGKPKTDLNSTVPCSGLGAEPRESEHAGESGGG